MTTYSKTFKVIESLEKTTFDKTASDEKTTDAVMAKEPEKTTETSEKVIYDEKTAYSSEKDTTPDTVEKDSAASVDAKADTSVQDDSAKSDDDPSPAQRDFNGGAEGDFYRAASDLGEVIFGNAGSDTLHGAAGDDYINGGTGIDWIDGRAGNDLIRAGGSNDWAEAGAGDDTVEGGDGGDAIYGEAGNDLLLGQRGTDMIYAGSGNDTVDGGEDGDVLFVSSGRNSYTGGAGSDAFVLKSFFDGDITTVTDFNALEDQIVFEGPTNGTTRIEETGGDLVFTFASGGEVVFENTALANLTPNSIAEIDRFGAYDAFINPQSPEDRARQILELTDMQQIAEHGATTILMAGNSAPRNVTGSFRDEAIISRDMSDMVDAGGGDDLVLAGAGHDLVHGGTGNDTINGGAGNDHLLGQSGNDIVNGGAGNDVLFAGSGTDMLTGGEGMDAFVFNNGLNENMNGFVTDFNAAEDKIVLVNTAGYTQAELEGQTGFRVIEENGAEHLQIVITGFGTLTLENTSYADLSDESFRVVDHSWQVDNASTDYDPALDSSYDFPL